ncbi:type II secretion system protein GspL [Ferrimonas sediminicola]|uniref:Type II secretion system protein L n=1 Tax=Ferrimonas sediminicola TaxID=2569538 RepID=A0A4U1BB44_9GAMM|nr:type II secretion system protein GspL [Ferrimonas sediminicola]TKB47647.1 type II secretion system protein GspL [Ferrimonas sediminicola]
MSERLVVRLGERADTPISWITWSEEQQSVIGSGVLPDAAALSSLTERAGGRPVEVLVDASALTLTQVTLPAKMARQALKGLPFMLEDELAQEVDKLHFVTGRRDGDRLGVAVVSHEQMGLWRRWLQEAGLKAARMVPDVLALPQPEGCDGALVQLEAQWLCRFGLEGSCVDADWLPLILTDKGQQSPVALAHFSPVELAVEGIQWQPQPLELPMQVLAQGMAQAHCNLLSGEYAPKRELGKLWQVWGKVAILAGIALALTLVYQGMQWYRIDGKRQQVRAESDAIYKQLFPNERVNPALHPSQLMAGKVRRLGGGGEQGELLTMLSELQPAFAAIPELKPLSLRYNADRGELRLQVRAASFAQFEQFQQAAGGRFQVDTGAMNNEEQGVSGALTVKVK